MIHVYVFHYTAGSDAGGTARSSLAVPGASLDAPLLDAKGSLVQKDSIHFIRDKLLTGMKNKKGVKDLIASMFGGTWRERAAVCLSAFLLVQFSLLLRFGLLLLCA